MEKLLVIDDSTAFLNDVESLLGNRYKVVKASSGKRGLELLESERVSAVLLDLKMPDMHGTEVLKRVHEQIDPHLPVIIVTGQHEVEAAVEAIRLGAYDFIPKSFNLELLTAKILKALERRSLEISVSALKSTQAEQYDQLIFVSEVMKKIHYEVTRLASSNFDVLITGETGVGKDRVAFELHQRSPRREGPFIPVPMRTLSETLIESELFGHEKGAFSGADRAKVGKLEAADGGSVYIPEVSSVNEAVQLKLLQFMQYKTVAKVGQDPRTPEARLDVRIIMATNEILEELVQKGNLRQDFYHRIAGVRLNIPPLRERVDDIMPLAEYFLKKFSSGPEKKEYAFAPDVQNAFRMYRWPGNVRELENVIKNAIAYSTGGVLSLNDFPHLLSQRVETDQCDICLATRFSSFPEYKAAETKFRRAYFTEALRRSGGNATKAAELVGMTPQGFRKILNTLKVSQS